MGRRSDRRALRFGMTEMGEVPGHGTGLVPLLDWTSRQPDAVDLEVACPEHPDPRRGPRGRTVVVLPDCIADLDPAWFLELLLVGAASVTLVSDGCGSGQLLEDRYRPLATFIERLGQGPRLRLRDTSGHGWRRPVLSAGSMPVSRRQLFLLPDAEQRPLPEMSGTPHGRLVAALRALESDGDGSERTAAELEDGPALGLVSDGCTACGVCVQACPEDALDLEVTAFDDDPAQPGPRGTPPPGDGTTLWMRAAACSGCGDCLEVCPVEALAAPGRLDWSVLLGDDWTELETLRTVVCRRCGGRFPAGGRELCPVCSYRSATPFGSALPPEVLARLDPEVARRFTERADPV